MMYMNGLGLTRKDKTSQSTALHRATVGNYLETTKHLISIGFDVNCVDENGSTPLHYCYWDDTESARLLLENNTNPNAQDNFGNTLYHCTLSCYKYKEKPSNLLGLLRLLHKFHANPNIQNIFGETALHLYFKAMLERVKTDELKFMYRRVPIEVIDLEFMLRHGADPNIQDESGRIPVYYLIMVLHSKFTDVFDLIWSLLAKLVQYGTRLNHRDINGVPVLHALINGYLLHPELFDKKLWLEILRPNYKVSVNIQDFYNRTALHLVSAKGDWKLAEIILNHGGNMEMLDCDGNTPLDVAIMCKQWDHARKLFLWPLIVAKRSHFRGNGASGSNTSDDGMNDRKYNDNSSIDSLLFRGLTLVTRNVKPGRNPVYNEYSTKPINNSSCNKSSKKCNNKSCNNYTLSALKNRQRRSSTTLFNSRQQSSSCIVPLGSCVKWTKKKLDEVVKFVANDNDPFYFTSRIIVPSFSDSRKNLRPKIAATEINKSSLLRLCEENSFEFHLTDTCREEHCLVAQQVLSLVKDLLQKCSEMDPRIKSELHWAGSSSEGTKMWLPDEFDFVMELVQLKGCCSINGLLCSYSQTLFLNKKCRSQWSNLCINFYHALSPVILKNYIAVLLWKAAFQLNKQRYPNIRFNLCRYNNDSHCFITETKVGINIRVRWEGEIYKNLTVSIDVTPAVPVEISESQFFELRETAIFRLEDECIHVVPYQGAHGEGWRASFSLMEVKIMKTLTKKQISLYKCLKLLRDVYDNSFEQIPSYYLKTILLNILFNDRYEVYKSLTERENFCSYVFRILSLLKKIAKYPSNKRVIEHFFVNDYLDIEFCYLTWCESAWDRLKSS